MNWIVFSYSLPAEANSARVALWRRLRRLGAISPTGGVYLLPALDDCVEAFQWLAQEIHQADGEALVMHVRQFEGLDDGQVIALFNQARQADYDAVATRLTELEREIEADPETGDRSEQYSTLQKLQRQHAEIVQIDYFRCPAGTLLAGRLNRVARRLSAAEPGDLPVARAVLAEYRHSRWVTRPRPHVDRLACIWLIRRFVNPDAVVRYSAAPEADEVGFDMNDVRFSHQGNFCTFEVMIRAFELEEAALTHMAEIVHEIDLRDGRYQRPETAGIDATLRGWLLAGRTDSELERDGLALFDGLYAALSQSVSMQAEPR